MASLAGRFQSLFAGLDRVFGYYEPTPPGKSGEKVKGKAVTRHEPLTLARWELHLAGTAGLGVTPIRDDSTVVFGAIDVDVYTLDITRLAGTVGARGYPFVVARTKSGGAHLYLFTSEPVPAALMRRKLLELARSLGYGSCEIFPKQDKIATEEDCGSWINVPYMGGQRSLRYGVGVDGKALTPEEFLDLAASRAIDLAGLKALKAIEPVANPLLPAGAPPCLHRLAADGFPVGGRNNSLFSLAVLAKKSVPKAEFEGKVREYYRAFVPGLDEGEVKDVIKSVGKKAYSYKCKDQPICAVCDKKTCATREFGVGRRANGVAMSEVGVDLGPLMKILTDPVTWVWEVNGVMVQFSSAQLMNQRLFQQALFERMSAWPPTVKESEWRDAIRVAATSAEVVEPPDDATADGQLIDHLGNFCTGRAAAKALDEILMGRPYTDPAAERVFFTAAHFLKYLTDHRVQGRIDERRLYIVFRDRGLETHAGTLKGKPVKYWSMPAFEGQTEDYEAPREAGREPM